MQTDEILHELTYAKDLPEQALMTAAERRAEMTPLFLEEIEKFMNAPPADEARPSPIFLIFHLLGDWKEKAAYKPLARLLRHSSKVIDRELGDAITVSTHRIMAAVYDGDPQPLFDIALDAKANEYIRSRIFETIAMLALRGELDKDLAAQFLKDGLSSIEPKEDCFVWNGWQSAIAMLGLDELRCIVRQAFDHGYVSEEWMDYDDFEEDLQVAIQRNARGESFDDREYSLFGGTIEELSKWSCFSKEPAEDNWQPDDDEEWAPAFPNEPYVNPYKGIGRNDTCPCGSGKKFKKCCADIS